MIFSFGMLMLGLFFQAIFTPALAEKPVSSEEKTMGVFKALQNLDMDRALDLSRELAYSFPNYKMGQTLHADLLAIRAGKPHLVNNVRDSYNRRTLSFQKEGQLRWSFLNKTQDISHHKRVLKVSDRGYFVLINADLHRLFLYRQTLEGLKKIDDFYISLGRKGMGKQKEGDLRTPIGVYLIDGWIDGETLPDLYGEGALTLNYPNAWDRKLERTGDGIWIHGTPANTYTRSPLASRGCVVLTNPEMKQLRHTHNLGVHTPVMLVSGESDLPLVPDLNILKEIQKVFKESDKGAIWSSLSVMNYPGEDNLYYVHFLTKNGSSIEQFWQYDYGGWQVVLQNNLSKVELASSL